MNPATNIEVANLELSCAKTVDQAVHSAKESFEEWSQTSVSNRIRYMLSFQQKIRENTDWLAEKIVEEQGKTMIGKIFVYF